MNSNLQTSPDIQVTENKLILTKDAIEKLQVTSGDRLSVNYVIKDECPRPVICVSDTDEQGNKLTKSLTVSFRGEQNKFLRLYGTEFVIEKSEKYNFLKNAKTKESKISLEIINK